jgi:AcrR family transcriptional regulator
MGTNRNAEQDILNAAREIFFEKGFKETTMRDIANKANINMAMLHYYFRSKENLFQLVFDEAFKLIYEKLTQNMADDTIDIFGKIRMFIYEYITLFDNNPLIAPFITSELIRNPEKFSKKIIGLITPAATFKLFSNQLENEIEKGTIRPISTLSLLIYMLSLCTYPAILKPVIPQIFSGIDTVTDIDIHVSRKDEIANFVIQAIKT